MTREPVALSTLLTAAVAAVLAALVGLDVLVLTPEETALVMGAVTALVALAGGVWARARATPTVDPRADDGTPLVPIPVPDDEPAPAGRHYRPVSDTGHPLT